MVSQFPLSSDFVLLRDAMNQLLQDSFVPSGGARSGWSTGTRNGTTARPMPLDVYATPDEAIVIAAVPGHESRGSGDHLHQNTLTLSRLGAKCGREQAGAECHLVFCASCGQVSSSGR